MASLRTLLRISGQLAQRRTLATSATARGGRLTAFDAPHGESSYTKWRTMFFVIAVPAMIAAHLSAFVYVDPESHKRPEFVPYEYLRMRTKKFPWGDGNHGLFHNPHTNALPDGYETEEEDHH